MQNISKIFVSVLLIVCSHLISFSQPELAFKVIEELGIAIEDCEETLFAEMEFPEMKGNSILVIPQIGYEEEGYFVLNTCVYIVDNGTAQIQAEFFESHQSSGWDSDAIYITEISIDTMPYYFQKDQMGFAIQVHTRGSSSPNPYSSKHVSFFMLKDSRLMRLLKNYEIYSYGGEWDMDCYGELYRSSLEAKLSNKMTNGYYDITLTGNNTQINLEKVNGECIRNERKEEADPIVLTFKDGKYQ